MASDTDADDGDADRVVLSYPADTSRRTRERVEQPYFRRYLAKTLGRVAPGDDVAEFTDVGCCGSRVDVDFRVERVEGGAAVAHGTEIEYVERDEEAGAGGWTVQNDF